MRGSIRMIIGFFLVFGAVGGMDFAPDSDLPQLLVVAGAGLLLMFSGLNASRKM